MTTSTLYDLTRIAALPRHGGLGMAVQLEALQEPAGAAQAREQALTTANLRAALMTAALQRASTAFDHAATALLSTMKPQEYITKGKSKP